ncbi:MAG TPA: penicillin-binding protein 2 [Candidatus Acidoferrum sp.]|nr:penicillin-binding protein 2 [Candidatus Acidoferrum sp.]
MKEQNLMDKNMGRYIFLMCCAFVITLLFIGRLSNLQIVNGADYRAKTEQKIYRTVPVSAPRGGVYDRYGRVLVVNRTGFSVSLDAYLLPKDGENDIILALLDLLQDEQLAFTDTLPVTLPPYEFYGEGADGLLTKLGLPEGTAASAVMAQLIEKYGLEDYSETEQRVLSGIRYEMERQDFSVLSPFIFAEDVSIKSVTAIKERQEMLLGVEVSVEAAREYATPYAAHILGRVGPIYKEDAESYLEKGYQLSDTVGKDGIEYTMESSLRGQSGTRVVEQNKFGKITNVISSDDAVPGNSVVLTLDINLQATAEKALAETVKSIAARGKARGNGTGYDAAAGAVVAISVNTGEILALASYPTYDLSTYQQNYPALLENKDKPLFNRAISGAYEPGSTYKMVTALAGLKEGTITPKTVITCRGLYTYYAPQIYRCWIYTDYGSSHGPMILTSALQNSCNCYFYEVGRLTGIEALDNWTRAVGLGEKTGIQLTGEVAGNVAGPESREKEARRWYDGNTIQAAIGQSDHLFTPIQMANYIATIANGGTRYKPTLVRAINNYHNTEIVETFEPEVLGTLDIDAESLAAIKAGMRSAAEVGTASSVFANYPVKVAGKTGTASVSTGTANGVFVCFAPYENPEIAIAVVIEHGGSGNASAPVAKAILDTYFAHQANAAPLPESEMSLID